MMWPRISVYISINFCYICVVCPFEKQVPLDVRLIEYFGSGEP